MTRRHNSRRGVLLLIVLSLLVLFVLIGVTFIVVAGRYTDAAKAYSRHEQTGVSAKQQLDDAVMTLLRGDAEEKSRFGRHSLLEDLYGLDGFQGIVARAYAVPRQEQFLRIEFNLPTTARPSQDFYSGSVLTLTNGPGAGQSTRVLRYTPPRVDRSYPGLLVVEAFKDVRPYQGDPAQFFVPTAGTGFLVNGKPFNGLGRGLQPIGTSVTRDRPLPLGNAFGIPDLEAEHLPFFSSLSARPLEFGDVDESHDAADFMNLFLGRVPSQIQPRGLFNPEDPLLPSFHRPFLVNFLLNKINDAGTLDNWQLLPAPAAQRLRRGVIARPLPDAHPFFSGSNPVFAGERAGGIDRDMDGIYDWIDADVDGDNALDDFDSDGFADVTLTRGPWDIDNDRDGVPDSVWVDLGAPVLTTKDGRRYKALYAILCVDMDGRVNINAHGTREVRNRFFDPAQGYSDAPLFDAVETRYAYGDDNTQLTTLRAGQGYGPAEIRLDRVLPLPSVAGVNLFERIIAQRAQPKQSVDSNWVPGPDPARGYFQDDFQKEVMTTWGIPSGVLDFDVTNGTPNNYRTPADLAGNKVVFLDQAGQPFYHGDTVVNAASAWPRDPATIQNPYAVDLLTETGNDNLFGEEDLEQLLRYNDLDEHGREQGDLMAALTPAGRQLLQFVSPELARRLTTRSFDLPVPNAIVPSEEERAELRSFMLDEYDYRDEFDNDGVNLNRGILAAQFRLSSSSIIEVATTRLREAYELANSVEVNALTTNSTDRTDWENFLHTQLQVLIAPEIRQGRKLDINRPFGNGIDDDGNGIVDEPGEEDEFQIWNGTRYQAQAVDGLLKTDSTANMYGTAVDFYYRNDLNNAYRTRQEFAKHLYCLAMLALDDDFRINGSAGPNAQAATARRIAQWAINAVDMRDRDAIMTPFEYDQDPFDEDGWSVNGYIEDNGSDGPDRRVVWGCESPQLLITETLAFHDRGIADRAVAGERLRRPENTDPGTSPTEKFVNVVPNETDDASEDDREVDNDLDQVRMPQGSLFIELHATGNRNLPSPPTFAAPNSRPLELYNTQNSSGVRSIYGELNLAAVAGDPSGSWSSVWRIAVIAPPETLDPTQIDPAEAATFGPMWSNRLVDDIEELNEQLNLEEALMATGLGQTGNGLPRLPAFSITTAGQAPRYIVFTNSIPTIAPGSANAYFINPAGGNAHIAPGGYAVLGPRQITEIGETAPQIFNLTGNNVRHGLTAGSPFWDVINNDYVDATGTFQAGLMNATSPNSPPLRTFVIASGTTLPWSKPGTYFANGNRVGISVSEPLPTRSDGTNSYYREPEDDLTYLSPIDRPEDFRTGRPLEGFFDDLLPGNTEMHGTYPRFRMAVLQRLANPLVPWDAVTNPYVNVDSQMIDLTVFNSVENVPTEWGTPDETDPVNPHAATPYAFDPNSEPNPPTLQEGLQLVARSRERGQPQETVDNLGPNLWSPLTRNIDSWSPTDYSDGDQRPTDGTQMLTTVVTRDPLLATSDWQYRFIHSLGALNSTYEFGSLGTRLGEGPNDNGTTRLSRVENDSPYVGSPVKATTPWLNWFDRPFVSQLELMQVPSSAPWALAYEARRVDSTTDIDRYFHRDFAHLLNFFHASSGGANGDPNLAAMLDWTEVPSRFVGTQTWLPTTLDYRIWSVPPTNPPTPPEMLSAVREFAPPFNKLSAFRDPGKININTIPDQVTWSAVDNRTPWTDVKRSLEGPQGATGMRNRPAYYSNPIRAAGSPRLMDNNQSVSSSEATLLRRDPGSPSRFLFEPSVGTSAATDPNYHPHFKYENLQRLGNMVTTHSNVYGVWITVGYFEVFPWNANDPYLTATPPLPPVPDEAHPDGWQLGPELGYESGEIERHRAFYLIDRSIPVGFQRGEDLNVDNAILLKRYIE